MHDRVTEGVRIAISGVLVAIIILGGVVAVPGVLGAKSSFIVLSGSMEPAIQPGDVVIVESTTPSDIQRGDVITFYEPGVAKEEQNRITHRVVAKEQTEQGVAYRTKGDTNEHRDPFLVDHSRVIGAVWFHVPMVGYALLPIQNSGLQPLLIVGGGLLLVGMGIQSLYEGAADANRGG